MQKDNTTLGRKASLRHSLLKQLKRPPVVIETHGGLGKVWELVYADVERGAVFEIDQRKVEVLAWQRPTWAVYQTAAATALKCGGGSHLQANLLDVDPYGDPWEVIGAFFESERPFPTQLGIAVNDGLRQGLKMGQGWQTESMTHALAHFGNAALYPRYMEVARWNMERIARRRAYEVTHWAAYYCGHAGQMTHYAAVLERGA